MDILPTPIKALHDWQGEVSYAGDFTITRGSHPFCRLVQALLSLPPEGTAARLRLTCRQDGNKEHWIRDVDGKEFHSVQWEKDGKLIERLKIVTLIMHLDASATQLNLRLEKVMCLGIPVTALFRPQVTACESEKNGKFHVNVDVTLPLFGRLIAYDGNLERC